MGRVWGAIQTLAEAQQRTEERLEELAQAQACTEECVGKLEAVVERPAQAQSTHRRVYRLAGGSSGAASVAGSYCPDPGQHIGTVGPAGGLPFQPPWSRPGGGR
jgi:hypothetical protein